MSIMCRVDRSSKVSITYNIQILTSQSEGECKIVHHFVDHGLGFEEFPVLVVNVPVLVREMYKEECRTCGSEPLGNKISRQECFVGKLDDAE